jgi:hypothetical protein
MALLVTTYNIVPDKWDAYLKRATESAIPRIMKIPGLGSGFSSANEFPTAAESSPWPFPWPVRR